VTKQPVSIGLTLKVVALCCLRRLAAIGRLDGYPMQQK